MQPGSGNSLTIDAEIKEKMLPLPLTPFEFLFFCDCSDAYPMNFIMQIDFSGHLDRERFESAWNVVAPRHPLLQANIDSSGRWPCWVAAEKTTPFMDWSDGWTPLNCPQGERIDLAQEIGVRIWVRHKAESGRLTMQIHHACCDGVAGLRILEELLVAYDREFPETAANVALRELNPEGLARRADLNYFPLRPAPATPEVPHPAPPPLAAHKKIIHDLRIIGAVVCRHLKTLASPLNGRRRRVVGLNFHIFIFCNWMSRS